MNVCRLDMASIIASLKFLGFVPRMMQQTECEKVDKHQANRNNKSHQIIKMHDFEIVWYARPQKLRCRFLTSNVEAF